MLSEGAVWEIPERSVLLLDPVIHVVDEVLIHIISLLFFGSGGRNMLLDFFIIQLLLLVLALFPDEFL
jgi:hypothetical protein